MRTRTVPCPERSYDVYTVSLSCKGQRNNLRHDCFVMATEEPGKGVDCITGQELKLDPGDPQCLQLLLTSPRALEACTVGLRVLNSVRGQYLDQRCGTIWGVDKGAAVDGPYYYIDERTLDTVARCGGACMSGNCKNCPPKEAACGPGHERQWQSLRSFYDAEFRAAPSPPLGRSGATAR